MKEIKIFEQVINSEKPVDLRKVGINRTMFWAYRSSVEAGNDLLNFDEAIWDEDIPEIVEICKEADITEFTISSTFSGLIETLASFEAHGWEMNGLTRVKSRHTDWSTGERAIIPAIRMVLTNNQKEA